MDVLCPSDSNSVLYPENKIGHYKVRLATPIVLDRNKNWTIALSSIAYPTEYEGTVDYFNVCLISPLLSHTGDKPILRTLTLDPNPSNSMRDITFNHLIRERLQVWEISEFEIKLEQNSLERVHFKKGKVLCKFLIEEAS